MVISCHYELPEFIKKNILGARLCSIKFQRGFVNWDSREFYGLGKAGIQLLLPTENKSINYSLLPKGNESIIGNLFGFEFEFEEWKNEETLESKGYAGAITLNDLSSSIQRILCLGEEGEYESNDPDTFRFWFGEDKPFETVLVRKRTMDIIAFLLSDGTWIYLVSNGINQYCIHFRSTTAPVEFVTEQGYTAMERKIVILEDIT